MVGSRITTEAAMRGHDVTAVSRNPSSLSPSPGVSAVAADANDRDRMQALLTDVAVISIRPAPGEEDTFLTTTLAVLDAASSTNTRVLVIGGAGPLRTPGTPELSIADNPDYVPLTWRAFASASTAQLRVCELRPDAAWTYLSPPAILEPGDRTGVYRSGTETLLVGPDGSSRISAEDLAVAAVDELENPTGHRHITVAY